MTEARHPVAILALKSIHTVIFAGELSAILWLVASGLVFVAAGASPKIAALIPIQLSSLALFALLLALLRSPSVSDRSHPTYPVGVPAES